MGAKVQFERKTEANLPTDGMGEDGHVYVSTDNMNMYVGVRDRLLPVNRSPYYATCPTAAETSVKVATVDDTEHFSLKTGVMVTVKFSNVNSGNSGRAVQLNVNGTGAKDMKLHEPWEAGDCVTFVYDGTRWVATTGSSVRYTAGEGVAINDSNVVSAEVDSGNANGLSVGRDGLALSTATTSSAGAMSADDKAKLDGIEDGAQANVQIECHAAGDAMVHAFPSALYTRLQGVRNVASTTTLNTGKAADNNDLELDLRFTCVAKPTSQYNNIFGTMSGSYERYYLGICTWTSNYNIRLGVRSTNDSIDSGIPLVAGHTYSVQAKMREGIATMHVEDETSGSSFSGSMEYTVDIATVVNIYMLRRSYSGGTILNGVLEYHRAVMRRGGVTRFDYIPAQRLSDSAVGFYDTVSGELVTATAGEFVAGTVTENVNDIIVTVPDIPHNTSDLTNDGSDGTSPYVEASDLSAVATSGSYNDLSDRPTIPSISGLAVDADVVHKAGTESVTGYKAFNGGVGFVGNANTGLFSIIDSPLAPTHSVEMSMGAPYDDGEEGVAVVQMYDDTNVDHGGTVIVRGVNTPITDTDAANKAYVDDAVAGGGGGGSAGNSKVFYGTCDTAASTTAKAVTCANFASSDLVAGVMVLVRFSVKNTGAVASLTLNVQSTGAYNIKKLYTTSGISNLTNAAELAAGSVIPFIFTGSYWLVAGIDYNTNTHRTLATVAPLMDGTADVGTSTAVARQDHVHPTDTSRAADADVVHKAGAEVVTGAKTFMSSVMIKDAQLRFETAGSVNRTIVMNSSGTTVGGFAVFEMTDEDETDNLVLRGISNPVDRNDAANKAYVDDIVGDIETLLNAI